MATLDLPGWGYAIRYEYGKFKQARRRPPLPACPWPSRGVDLLRCRGTLRRTALAYQHAVTVVVP